MTEEYRTLDDSVLEAVTGGTPPIPGIIEFPDETIEYYLLRIDLLESNARAVWEFGGLPYDIEQAIRDLRRMLQEHSGWHVNLYPLVRRLEACEDQHEVCVAFAEQIWELYREIGQFLN